MEEYVIETTNLSKRFYPAKSIRQLLFSPFARTGPVFAVEGVSLQIKRPESFALVGPNGAGKTTLIKILSCLILPTEGSARINGHDIIKDEMGVKDSIGLLTSEERSFYWRLTGRENLHFFACLYNLSKQRAKQRIKELSGLLQVEDLDKRFQEYSTGMKQRIAICRSLLNDPCVLLMDEPTKNLDPIAAEDLRQLIKKKLVELQGKTVLFCTHNLNEARSFADRIAIIDKARVKACGSWDELSRGSGLPSNADMEAVFKYYVAK